MTKSAISRHPGWKQTVLPMVAGLVFSQFLGTFYVRQSNLHLYHQIQTLIAAGWFPVPNGPVISSLKDFATAGWGGLFYTLSAGAALTLATWASIRLGKQFYPASRTFNVCLAVIWLGLVAVVNIQGPTLFATLFAFGVPLVTALAVLRGTSGTKQQTSRWMWCIPAAVLIGLTAMWSTQMNRDLFTVIRDHVLLSNPVGRSVNDFYYRYTLYAAEAFKSFQQKTIRTCTLKEIQDPRLGRQLESTLARWDIMAVTDSEAVDMVIRQDGPDLQLIPAGGKAVRVKANDFLKNTGDNLQSFSEAGDRQKIFRRLIFAGVLIGFPVLLYMLVYGLIRFFVGLAVNGPAATWLTSGICLLIGVLLFVPMLSGRNRNLSTDQLPQALRSDNWNQRVAALRQTERQRIDIGRIVDYSHLLTSNRVVERYWLARNLAHSRNAAAYRDLLILIKDPHPNVVCQAFYALGRQGKRTAIDPIKTQIMRSDHWYTQFYGYRAIRKLGWNQTQSRPIP